MQGIQIYKFKFIVCNRLDSTRIESIVKHQTFCLFRFMGIENYTQLYGFNNPAGLPIYIEINVYVCVCVCFGFVLRAIIYRARKKHKSGWKTEKKRWEKK